MDTEKKEYLKITLLSYQDNCPNFTEIHRNFNQKFESKLSVTILKREILKIAQENNYQILSRQELARQKETKILEYGKKEILKPDWESFSQTENIPIEYCKMKFAELLPIDQKNALAYEALSDITQLENALNEFKVQCTNCQSFFFDSMPAKWKDQPECFKCNQTHTEEIEALFQEVDVYLNETGKKECLSCGLVRDETTKKNFHLDHINIFNKSDSVCSMVRNGDSLENIKAEVDKCQLLCKPCHHLVTKLEQMLGYTQLKSKITRELVEVNSETYQNLYENQFQYLYQKIKSVVSSDSK